MNAAAMRNRAAYGTEIRSASAHAEQRDEHRRGDREHDRAEVAYFGHRRVILT